MRVLQQPCPVQGLSVCPCTRISDLAPWRVAVLHEALSWLRTPYHHHAGVKGAGCDCAYLLIRCYELATALTVADPGYYPADWNLHRSEERYLGMVLRYCLPVEHPLPADVCLYRFGRTVAHGGIVVEWPLVVHAVRGQGVILSDASQAEWASRFEGFYALKEGG